MQIQMVKAHYERTLNLGDYNSAKISAEVWATLDEGEDAAAVFDTLWACAKDEVKEQVVPLVAKQTAKAAQLFAGLPVELQAEVIKQGAAQVEGRLAGAAGKLATVAANLSQMTIQALAEDVASGLDPRDGMPFGDK